MKYIRITEHSPVITCTQAAKARGICLERELKTLVLRSKQVFLAAHLRGSDSLDSLLLRQLVGSRHLVFLSEAHLARFNLSPGRINPWRVPCDWKNYVCRRVLQQSTMMTNAGALNKGVEFLTKSLCDLPNLTICDLARK